jgi:hypothetical protein
MNVVELVLNVAEIVEHQLGTVSCVRKEGII